jgi:hypothetical protein
LPSWVLGFHGTDAETVNRVLNSQTAPLRPSKNDYDWLGEGVYFWENDPERAMSFITEKMKRDKDLRQPAVIGAVIDLGFCMNLVDRPALLELKAAHDDMEADFKVLEQPLPRNEGPTDDLLRRFLDKAVFDHVHTLREDRGLDEYQTVRSPFLEGKPLYENTFFKLKTHIQIAVRDHTCIKGYFLPRQSK